MPRDRPKPLDRLGDALVFLGHVAVGLLGLIAVVVLSTRLRWVVMMLVIVPIGVVVLLVSSALWGGLLSVVGRLLGLPIGPSEGLPAAEAMGQVMAPVLALRTAARGDGPRGTLGHCGGCRELLDRLAAYLGG